MYYNLICILYALLCGQNFILVKSGCYKFELNPKSKDSPHVRICQPAKFGEFSTKGRSPN
jgi:hypothetical protein